MRRLIDSFSNPILAIPETISSAGAGIPTWRTIGMTKILRDIISGVADAMSLPNLNTGVLG